MGRDVRWRIKYARKRMLDALPTLQRIDLAVRIKDLRDKRKLDAKQVEPL